jgi:hypothetical protein
MGQKVHTRNPTAYQSLFAQQIHQKVDAALLLHAGHIFHNLVSASFIYYVDF